MEVLHRPNSYFFKGEIGTNAYSLEVWRSLPKIYIHTLLAKNLQFDTSAFAEGTIALFGAGICP
jgi:hypothetical protein